ncbi:hypothetical protein HOY80DRAFT_881095 [Tuber brumale]|nr:hypothetical protein HOY80DRAFT_881095 [Tuber brumale]
MPLNRLAWRNAYIYDSRDRDTAVGGLWVSTGISNSTLYYLVQIFCIFTDTFSLRDDNEKLVLKDEQPLRPGNYYISTDGSLTVTDEVPLVRTLSLQSGTRLASFCRAVRVRDQRCVITGRKAIIDGVGFWTVFEVAHVFPLAYEEHWNENNFSRCITVSPASESEGSINSVQNGILLERTMHALFDSYEISINPDDEYKIICFTPLASSYGIAGRNLDQSFLENPHRPVDHLLRWHFRQAVLVNMKGAGEPCFETDFPPGSDVMGDIINGPKPRERMEFELLTRFNAMGSAHAVA